MSLIEAHAYTQWCPSDTDALTSFHLQAVGLSETLADVHLELSYTPVGSVAKTDDLKVTILDSCYYGPIGTDNRYARVGNIIPFVVSYLPAQPMVGFGKVEIITDHKEEGYLLVGFNNSLGDGVFTEIPKMMEPDDFVWYNPETLEENMDLTYRDNNLDYRYFMFLYGFASDVPSMAMAKFSLYNVINGEPGELVGSRTIKLTQWDLEVAIPPMPEPLPEAVDMPPVTIYLKPEGTGLLSEETTVTIDNGKYTFHGYPDAEITDVLNCPTYYDSHTPDQIKVKIDEIQIPEGYSDWINWIDNNPAMLVPGWGTISGTVTLYAKGEEFSKNIYEDVLSEKCLGDIRGTAFKSTEYFEEGLIYAIQVLIKENNALAQESSLNCIMKTYDAEGNELIPPIPSGDERYAPASVEITVERKEVVVVPGYVTYRSENILMPYEDPLPSYIDYNNTDPSIKVIYIDTNTEGTVQFYQVLPVN